MQISEVSGLGISRVSAWHLQEWIKNSFQKATQRFLKRKVTEENLGFEVKHSRLLCLGHMALYRGDFEKHPYQKCLAQHCEAAAFSFGCTYQNGPNGSMPLLRRFDFICCTLSCTSVI